MFRRKGINERHQKRECQGLTDCCGLYGWQRLTNNPDYMKDREATIEFEMNYCQHYGRGKGADMVCKAGMDLKAIKKVATGQGQIKWGPCIGGHTLANPHEHCPHWIRRTREMGEKRADAFEASMKQLEIANPVISAWRKKEPYGKSEVIECPVCKGRLHLCQSSYNGHVRARCETKDCIAFIE